MSARANILMKSSLVGRAVGKPHKFMREERSESPRETGVAVMRQM